MAGDLPAKIYLMATPSSGKSYFANGNQYFRGVRVIDFSVLRLERREAGDYHRKVHRFLQDYDSPVCLLGRRGPKDLTDFDGVTLGVVLPSMEDHLKFVAARAAEHRRDIDRWADEENILEARKRLAKYAKKRKLPVFTSFREAAEALIPEEQIPERDSDHAASE